MTQLTEEGYTKLQNELKELIDDKKPHALERLQKARAMGDLRENSEYSAAKEELSFIEGRIAELEELIKNAEVIKTKAKAGTVQIGDTIMVEKNGASEEYTIVGEFEADPMAKKLSNTSPIGKALIGKKIGQSVDVEVPAGKITYTIKDIKKS